MKYVYEQHQEEGIDGKKESVFKNGVGHDSSWLSAILVPDMEYTLLVSLLSLFICRCAFRLVPFLSSCEYRKINMNMQLFLL